MRASLAVWLRTIGAGSPSGRAIELDRVWAAVSPAVPERSVFNGVAYQSPEALGAALPELARAYDDAGVLAWTVWVPEGDRRAADTLAEAGHVLDAEPRAMGMRLGSLAPSPVPEGCVVRTPAPEEIAAVLDESYGFEPGTYASAYPELVAGMHHYLLVADGRPACTLSTLDHGGDCGVYFVGTVTDARGRGLATALTGRALQDARRRGCTTTTLQATRMGRPIYARLGYGDLGAVQMWERRRAKT
jgi:GNAT superfamily N-acetyltransferase